MNRFIRAAKNAAVFIMSVIFLMIPVNAGAFFCDIPEDAWYRLNAAEAEAKGWFEGDHLNRFQPESNTTRAEAAKVLYSYMFGSGIPSDHGLGYWDVENSAWYEPYVNLNISYDIIPAYGNYFEPEVYITRLDLVTAIMRAAQINTGQADRSCLNPYSDRNSIPEESLDVVAAAVQNGILSGYADGKLRMNAPVTRAQFAVFMSRISAPEWEQGSIDNDGIEFASNIRVRSDYFYTPACTVNAGDGMSIAYLHYNNDYTLSYDSGWLDGEQYLPSGIYRLVVRYKSNADIHTEAGSGVVFNYMPSVNDYDVVFRTAAHRGGAFGAPQNTVSAFALAASKGYSYIECDVRWTKDNVPIICHDSSVGSASCGFGKISSITLGRLRTYSFADYIGTQYADERLATYEEMLQCCKQRGLNPYVEIYDGEDFTVARARQLIQLAQKYGMEYRITWISSYYSVLQVIKDISALPDLRMLYVCSEKDYSLKWRLAELKNSTNRVGLDVNYQYLDADYISFIKEAGFDVESWTVDDYSTAQQLINMGITGITTNSLAPF